jgi:hypothetical protein
MRRVCAVTLGLRPRPRAVVLLGDVEPAARLDAVAADMLDAGIAVAWLHGNHDVDGGVEMWADLCDPARNPRTSQWALDGRVVELAGLRVAGLGGVFMERVWHPRSGGGAPRARTREEAAARAGRPGRPLGEPPAGIWESRALPLEAAIYPETYERLADLSADVLAAHEAPDSHEHGYEEIALLARVMGARAAFHGHHHDGYVSVAGDGLVAVGVGRLQAVDAGGNVLWTDPDSLGRAPPRLSNRPDWTRAR